MMDENGGQIGTDSNPMEQDPAKMFIGGLHSQSTADSLQRYFEKYGEIKECVVMRDAVTKRSRGFGFVRYTDPDSVDKVQNDASHIVDGKKVDPKRAIPKRPPPGHHHFRKVFVGGLPPDITVQELTEYFEAYGKVTEVLLLHDRNTKRLRGFGFITFESEHSGKHVCETGFHKLKGKNVECKKAQPKEAMMMQGKGQGIFVNLSPFPFGRGYPNGIQSPCNFGVPDWSLYPQLYQQLVNVMQVQGGRGKAGYTAGGNFVAPQGFMSMPDHRRTTNNQYYPEYNNVQNSTGSQNPTTETVSPHTIEVEHQPLSTVQFTTYGSQPSTVVTPASPLTHVTTRPEMGNFLPSRTAFSNDQPLYHGPAAMQSPQTAFGHNITPITLRH